MSRTPKNQLKEDQELKESVGRYKLRKLLNLPIDIFRGVARDLIGIGLTFFAATGVAAGLCLY